MYVRMFTRAFVEKCENSDAANRFSFIFAQNKKDEKIKENSIKSSVRKKKE